MLIKYDDLLKVFEEILLSRGFSKENANSAASVFANNSLDGIYSHGVNRFPRVVSYLDKGEIDPKVVPSKEFGFNGFERWNGHRGFGPLNAKLSMDRACDLASQYGIGCVGLGNSNHWMRGGSYGWQAANRGMIGICWSNTTANMPAWGGLEPKIGNNPLVMAVPRSNGQHVVLDCAVSQYSYGKIEMTRMEGKKLPFPGGFDTKGNLTDDPAEIEKTGRVLPMGYWKGSGLSILLDLIATILTNANPVNKIKTFNDEVVLSQVFIAIDPSKVNNSSLTDEIVNNIIDDIHSSTPVNPKSKVLYPGENEYLTRLENTKNGIPVLDEVWQKIQACVRR